MPDTFAARVVFFGTPSYAAPTLKALVASDRFDVVTVVTQPDRPAGRGHRLVSPPIKDLAVTLNVPVLQPQTLRDEVVRDQLRALNADLFVVAAYGLIFSQVVLNIPAFGCVNLHASLLPKFRGAAPVTAAILAGEQETGITLMMMERGLDTGPIIAERLVPIRSDDTTESLTANLAEVGATLTIDVLPDLLDGRLIPTPQPDGGTVVRQLTKMDGLIDWHQDAVDIERQVRAMWSWPRAWTHTAGLSLQIHAASVVETGSGVTPGATENVGEQFLVGTGKGYLRVDMGQIAGSRPLAGSALVRSGQIPDGIEFESVRASESPLIRSA